MGKKINIETEDAVSLLLFSFRYVLGRATYAPSLFVDIFQDVYSQLDVANRHMVLDSIITELENAFRLESIKSTSLGWKCDSDLWHNFYDMVKERKERLNNETK